MKMELPNFEVLAGFIVLEGLDGSGTTTQCHLLQKKIVSIGKACQYTCEPTESFIGKAVRQVLQNEQKVAAGTLAKLFAADRHNHIYHPDNGIIAALEQGNTVISDRYLFSSLAYQSVDWNFDAVWELNRHFPLPEELIFLDVSPDEGYRRVVQRNTTREIYERMEFQEEIRSNYFHAFTLFQHTDMNIHIFDGTLPVEELEELVWNKLSSSDK
jgi:dTMP kinase